MDKRSDQIEEALAHLTQAVEDLSDVVARQDGEIARLTARVDSLRRAEAERQIDAGGTIPLADQQPPHW